MKPEKKIGVCEVHQYALGDTTPREVMYCDVCEAWICAPCSYNPFTRAVAMANKKLSNRRKRIG